MSASCRRRMRPSTVPFHFSSCSSCPILPAPWLRCAVSFDPAARWRQPSGTCWAASRCSASSGTPPPAWRRGGEAARARAFSRPLIAPGELRAAFEAAGLLDVVDTPLVMRMDYSSCDDFWGPIAAGEGPMGAFLAQLEAEDRSRLTEAVRRAYLGGRQDGPRSFIAVAWACRGTTPKT